MPSRRNSGRGSVCLGTAISSCIMINAFAQPLIRRIDPRAIIVVMAETRPVVISGPSGAGKSTLIKKLFQEYPESFGFSVSHTTRKLRNGEVDGKQYHFVSVETMKREIDEGKFIEYTNFSGNYYGTSIAAVKAVADSNKICILDIDEQGVRNIKNSSMDAVYIFIQPPSMEELRRRLTSRGTETKESMERRMDTAVSAVKFSKEEGVYDLVLENDELEKAYKEFKDFLKQTCPAITSKESRYNSTSELPLAANVRNLHTLTRMEAGDSNQPKENGFTEVQLDGNSIAEIPLSPSKSTPGQDKPAEIVVTETPLLVMTDMPNDDFSSHGNSSAVVELEGDPDATVTTDGVCGRQSWCSIS